MLIRPATREDTAGIATLVESYWEFESLAGFERPRLERLLHSLLAEPQRGACWVAESDGRLCGYLLAVFMLSFEHGGMMAEIDEVFVSAEMRSQSLGSLLMAHAEQELTQRGMTRLQLQLGVGNARARSFYENRGFRRRAGYELLDKPLPSRDP